MKAFIIALLALSYVHATTTDDVVQWYQGMFDGAGVGQLTDIPACVDDPTSTGIIDFYQGWADAISELESTGVFKTLGATTGYMDGEGETATESVNNSVWKCIADSDDDASFKDKVGVTLSPTDLKAKLKFASALSFSSDNRHAYKEAFTRMSDLMANGEFYEAGNTYTTFASKL